MKITYKTFWADKEMTVEKEVVFTGTNPSGIYKYYDAVDGSRSYEIAERSRHANHWWDDMITINKGGVFKKAGYEAKVS